MAFYQIKPRIITAAANLDFPLGTNAASLTDTDGDGLTDSAEAVGDPFLVYNGTGGNNALQTNNGQWIVYDNTSVANTSIVCNFDLPQLRPDPEVGYGFLSTATNGQRFRMWVRRTLAVNEGPPPPAIPTASFGVSNGTVELISQAVDSITVNSTTGQYVDFTWTFDPGLFDADATNIHLSFVQDGGGGSGIGANRRTRIEIGAIEWYAQFNDPVPYLPKTTVHLF